MEQQIRILCVDDERNVLRALERIFLDDDYEILTASSGEEGLQILDEADQVQVVISDYRMPGMNGVEFLKEVFQRHPETIRIVLSGYADTAAVVAAINEGKIYKFIPKPWNDDELRMTVVKALETFAIHRQNLHLAEELRTKNAELSELNASLERLVAARTSELMQQNRALLHARNVLEQLPVGVVGIDHAGSVVQMNPEAGVLLGVDPARCLGAPISSVLPGELSGLVEELSRNACCCQGVRLAGGEIRVQGVTMDQEGDRGCILTITRGEHP